MRSHAFFHLLNCGIKCKAAVTTLVYEKSLKMSAKGRAATDQGTAVNLLANDAEKLFMGIFAFQMLFTAPVRGTIVARCRQAWVVSSCQHSTPITDCGCACR